ncbi:MAG: hypothetical protein ABIQ31_05405 [Ferruginibacter sp.]
MQTNSSIQYLTQLQIDKEKWDACMARSANGLIYGYSFYLDHMARHWDALVLNDYEAVMPLTWNKKYGVVYLYQPFCCALLGVFGQNITADITRDFLQHIPTKFRYWDIYLNHGNDASQAGFSFSERKNFILPLHQPYAKLCDGFSDNIKRNTKKAAQLHCSIEKPPLQLVLKMAKQQMQDFANTSREDFERFTALYNYLQQQNAAITYGTRAENGELLSSAVFFTWQQRAYYILAANNPNSRSTGASHALINAFIRDHADTDTLLDFEGSDLPNLALFYRSFGATQQNYPAIKYNRLPALIKWLKK